MISLDSISINFGGRELFNNLSFVINPKDRIGLVGKNGVGKSTLMQIIIGHRKPDTGGISIQDGKTIGYLPQEINVTSRKTILEETLTVFAESMNLEKDIENINKELETRTDYESDSYIALIEKLTDSHERLQLLGSGKQESEAEKVLKGLGFAPSDFSRPINEFSGGWQMRVELGKLLLMMPSLLLLDEPTNHLDIESIIWLEEFFKNYPGALMMVSHDRMFLDEVTNRTVELVFGRSYDYKVPYSKYFELREERYQNQLAAYENQQRYIAQQERFIERFKAKNTKAKQAQSKMKQLDKLERVEFDELDNQSIQFRFPPAPRSGDTVLRGKQVGKSYDAKLVLQNLDFEIERGDRVAFVGKNGEGKSTLVKLINGKEGHTGELTIGHNVAIGYYAQIQEGTLSADQTVFETLDNIATGEWRNISRLRGLLGAFLFGAEEIDKKVKVLSGGEKSRLALAKLLLDPVNLLILDEPTNHLDLSAKEVLKQALLHYNGTLIVVSHDRDFLQGLTNKTYEFNNHKIKEHLGEISEFLDHHRVDTFRQFEAEPKVMSKPKPAAKKVEAEKKQTPKLSHQERKDREKGIRQAKRDIHNFEKSITQLEDDIAALEVQMQDPEFFTANPDGKNAIYKHADLQKELDKTLERWEEAGELLEKLEKG